MTQKYAFISDFDGTITDDDFFTLISEKYFDEKMLSPWKAYLSGKETHFNALNAMFQQIHIDESELNNFICQIRYDNFFRPTAELCQEKKIPMYICSAGCDYYIKELIGQDIKKYNIELITNHGVYDKKHGLRMIAPNEDSPYYDESIGISKKTIVEKLKSEGYTIIFAGDGPPDFEPAKQANTVFAKKILLKRCQEHNIKTKSFNDFSDIYNFIKGL